MQQPNEFWVYDLETLPNFTSIVMFNPFTHKYKYAYDYGMSGNIRKLVAEHDTIHNILVGYNNKAFDDIILAYILEGRSTIEDIYEIAQDTIKLSNERQLWKSDIVRFKPRTRFVSIDLFMLFNPTDRVSLKKVAVSLNAPVIQEMPVKHTHFVEEHEIKSILQYNKYDVHDTAMIFVALYDEIELRTKIGPKYGLGDVLSSCRSQLAKQMLGKMYEDFTKIPYREFNNWRTIPSSISFKDCINSVVKFNGKGMQDAVEQLRAATFDDITKIKFKKEVLIGNTVYTIATGGLHSNHKPTILKSENGHILWDWDFGSWYPNLMLNLGIYPKHLGKSFLVLFRRIVSERLQSKSEGDMVAADTLKIVVNAAFGLLKYKGSWLYDPLALYRVTLNGQLFILMIIEDLEENDIPVVYANTDGWMVNCPIDKVELMKKICQKWGGYFNIPLEDQQIEKAMVRDVNNYSLRTMSGKFKQKGDFIFEPVLGKSYDAPIVAFAIHEWFYHNVKVEKTITECTDITMFFMTQNIDKSTFCIEYHHIEDGKLKIKPLQDINRYIAARGFDSGVLYKKHKQTGALEHMLVSSQVHITNIFDYTKPIESYPLNLQYYIARTNKLINRFTITQTSLF